jgi:hypothetical protein
LFRLGAFDVMFGLVDVAASENVVVAMKGVWSGGVFFMWEKGLKRTCNVVIRDEREV